jgi:hypothetical protein
MRNLSSVLESIRHRRHHRAAAHAAFARLSAYEGRRGQSTAYHAGYQDEEEGDDIDDLLLPPSQMRAIVENYDDLIINIRNSIMKQRSDSSSDILGDSTSRMDSVSADLSGVMSNREIKVITAVVAGTRELLSALEGLLSVVHRMRAHRNLHIGQDGRML